MARRPKPEEEIEVVEEEVREEKRAKPKTLKRLVTELIVRTIGRDATQHLINAEIEVFKALRAMIDYRIRSAERAAEKLQEIEVQ
jgi:predicted Fe-Mo cluster-binding NifX family protein